MNDPRPLSARARWVCGIGGIALVLIGLLMICRPPYQFQFEFGTEIDLLSVAASTRDLTSFATVSFLAGLALLVFAVNGYRVIRVSAAGVSADTAVTENAKRQMGDGLDDSTSKKVTLTDEEPPVPTEAPIGQVSDPQGELDIFQLTDVPLQVIRDTLTNWPAEESKPPDLGAFEFAARRRGRGNHPWTLKFRGSRPIVVSYGGQAKSGATVQTLTGNQ